MAFYYILIRFLKKIPSFLPFINGFSPKQSMDDNSLQAQTIISSGQAVHSEIIGQNWLQKSWRPLLMISITLIMINKYLILPYIQAFWNIHLMVQLPDDFFDLLIIGAGGYLMGRSIEKKSSRWKNPDEF